VRLNRSTAAGRPLIYRRAFRSIIYSTVRRQKNKIENENHVPTRSCKTVWRVSRQSINKRLYTNVFKTPKSRKLSPRTRVPLSSSARPTLDYASFAYTKRSGARFGLRFRDADHQTTETNNEKTMKIKKRFGVFGASYLLPPPPLELRRVRLG